ncbi:MAG TPA: hypothetical protein VIS72_11595 [Anaerolineales bacterium]
MKLQEIKHAITELNPKELARFRQWFEKFEKDAKSSELDKHTDKALLRKRVNELRGSLKGSGAMKAFMEERRKG